MRNAKRWLSVGIVLLSASRAFGQDVVALGDRVKLLVSPPRQTIVGTMKELTEGLIVLDGGIAVERGSVAALYRSQGLETHARPGAFLGGVAGLLLAGSFTSCACAAGLSAISDAPVSSVSRSPCDCTASRFTALIASTVAGAGIGAVVGHRMKGDRWQRVALSIEPRLALSRSGHAPAFSLRVSW